MDLQDYQKSINDNNHKACVPSCPNYIEQKYCLCCGKPLNNSLPPSQPYWDIRWHGQNENKFYC